MKQRRVLRRRPTNDPISEAGGEKKVRMTVDGMKGLTQALVGAAQMLKALVRRFNLDREKSRGIKEVGRVIEGIASSMDRCVGQPERRRRTKFGQVKVEGSGRKIEKRTVSCNERRDEVGQGLVSEYPKRKWVSPGEGEKAVAVVKRPRKGEPTYAEMCGRSEGYEYSDRERSEDSDSWQAVVRRKRERRTPQEPLSTGVRGNEQGLRGDSRGAATGRRRKEAILIKVEEGRDWMEIYRKIVTVRETIVGASGRRKTRAGHILIEFDREVVVSEVAEKLRAALSDNMEMSVLVSRTTMQIKNIDPLTTKEKLAEDLKRKWGMSVCDSIGVKSMRIDANGGVGATNDCDSQRGGNEEI